MRSVNDIKKKKYSVLGHGAADCGWLYFYVHFATEVVCFFTLTRMEGAAPDIRLLMLLPLAYDFLAFVPQLFLGELTDRFRKFDWALLGCILMFLSCLLSAQKAYGTRLFGLFAVCMANCLLHLSGAEVTMRVSDGRLSHSAIFVGGGSFGVITGRLLAATPLGFYMIAAFSLTMIPFVLLAELRLSQHERGRRGTNFSCAKACLPGRLVIAAAFVIVCVRAYMAYGIPTSWNTTVIQNVLLFCSMGVGKAAGGILADLIGVRKTALLSTGLSLPFLLAGDRLMGVSLIGIMLFSMTMPITLALIASVLKDSPGVSFGLTTTALFLGTAPVFFLRPSSFAAQAAIVSSLTVLCFAAFAAVTEKDGEK